MALVKRATKGAELTHDEMDGNWTEIETGLASLTTTALSHTSQIASLPQFYRDGSSNVQGLSDGVLNYPMVANPVEVLALSAIGWNSSVVGSEEVMAFYTIKGGTLGPNSMLQIDPLWTYTNSANNKNLQIKVGGWTMFYADRTTSVKEAPFIAVVNRNSLSSQIRVIDSGYVVASTTAPHHVFNRFCK